MKQLLFISGLSFCLSACSGVDSLGGLSDHSETVAKPVTQSAEKTFESSKQTQQAASVPPKNQHNQEKQSRANQINNYQTSLLDRYLTNRLTASMRDAGDRITGQQPPIYYHPNTGQYYYGRSGAANYHFNQYLRND